jgi:hypothetical protein
MGFFLYFALALAIVGAKGIVVDQKEVTPFLTLTFVHGDDEARMTHSEARKFCMNLPKLLASGKIQVNGARSMQPTWGPLINPTASKVSTTKSRTFGDLMSIHDPTMVHELMAWVLPMEKKQFWIGGIVRRVAEDFQNRPSHFIQAWTDGTPANFRYLHFSNEELDTLNIGGTKCLSVDYASGKWGAHDCNLRMYFVCETITLPDVTPSDSADANETTMPTSGTGTTGGTQTTATTPLTGTSKPN